MEDGEKLIRVFTGSEVSVILLKGELEDIGIPSLIRNDFKAGVSAGFSGAIIAEVDLYIKEADWPKAEPIVRQIIAVNGD